MKRYLLFLSGFLCSGLCLFAQTDSTFSDTSAAFNNTLDTVIFSTGFQKLPRERATGSFTQIGNELFNRRVGPDVLSRLDGIASGVVFNATTDPTQIANQSSITIRGRSTLFANPSPLIVVDNFPYDGDLNNINPNDVESVTILKDAAAASIWGARSSNGVIVITTKQGKLNQPMVVNINANVGISEVPNLYYQPQLLAKDLISLERFFFDNNEYVSSTRTGYSPVVDLLFEHRNGAISDQALANQLTDLSGQDARDDLKRFVYRPAINEQYAIMLQGGTRNNQFVISAGFDKNLKELRSNDLSKYTFNAQNTLYLLQQRMSVHAGMYYVRSLGYTNNRIIYPRIYERRRAGWRASCCSKYLSKYIH